MAKPMMQVEAGSLKMTVVRIRGMKAKIKVAAAQSIQAAGQVLYDDIMVNATYRDHTLDALDRLDNPYAIRHGRIRIHTRKPWVVHAQGTRKHSTDMHTHIKHKYFKTKRYYKVWILESHPYARHVIRGTHVMHGRDFLVNTMNSRKTKKRMMKAAVRVLGKKLRLKAVVRFD
jgi:hypothetical protein